MILAHRPQDAAGRGGSAVPNAVALAEITAMPRGTELPAMGAHVVGEVIDHAHRNHLVKVRLPG
ncbi:hypothetical protein GCM10010121_055110 [Streptomyces brasiliensis]|uniref:Uncharacterized protein n=1 Tax=Streptomyces brasiliensis TaxID=1954 RepID=A0A917KYY8_9ACTN|nr:hypothetical protein GCM10010121_055110 [Streptomyces brasiliensis]